MSALKPCNACGKMIAKNAKSCPNCGAKNKKNSSCMTVFLVFFVFCIVLAAIFSKRDQSISKSQASTSEEDRKHSKEIVKERLAYLRHVPELKGIQFNDYNEICILLRTNNLPEDYGIICNAAALNASEALMNAKIRDNECTIYLLPSDASPGDKDKALYKAVAKRGVVQEGEDTQNGIRLKLSKMTPQEREKYVQEQKAQIKAGAFEDKYVSRWDGSVKPVVQYVKNSMNDPKSFEHVNTQWGIVSGTTDRYWVNMTFRGTNAFGATVTNTIKVEVDSNGNVSSR